MDETQAERIRRLTQREPQPKPEPTEEQVKKAEVAKENRRKGRAKAAKTRTTNKHLSEVDELSKKYPRVNESGYDFDSVPASHPGWQNLMDAITSSFQNSRGEES